MENNQSPDENRQLNQAADRPPSLANSRKVIQPLSPDLQAPVPADPTPIPQPPVQPTIPPPPSTPPTPTIPAADQATPLNAPTDTYIGLTGSQIVHKKERLPIGIYVITVFSFLGVVASFFDSSENSAIYSIALVIDLLLTIGLLFRLEAARKAIIWLLGITFIICVVSIFLLAALEQRIEETKVNYEAAISRIDQNRLTSTQKQKLKDLQSNIAAQEKQAGKAITFTYIKLGVTSLETILVIIYLTRPKVKAVFHKLEH